jgi:hypothetical protein
MTRRSIYRTLLATALNLLAACHRPFGNVSEDQGHTATGVANATNASAAARQQWSYEDLTYPGSELTDIEVPPGWSPDSYFAYTSPVSLQQTSIWLTQRITTLGFTHKKDGTRYIGRTDRGTAFVLAIAPLTDQRTKVEFRFGR